MVVVSQMSSPLKFAEQSERLDQRHILCSHVYEGPPCLSGLWEFCVRVSLKNVGALVDHVSCRRQFSVRPSATDLVLVELGCRTNKVPSSFVSEMLKDGVVGSARAPPQVNFLWTPASRRKQRPGVVQQIVGADH